MDNCGMKRLAVFICAYAFICAGFGSEIAGLWGEVEKFEIPRYKVEKKGEVDEIIFEGPPYKGAPTEVFAYYSNPSMVGAGAAKGKYPAILCIHGGGGTAYDEWVKIWARRGYAAMAIDWDGCRPDSKFPMPERGKKKTRLEHGGPEKTYENIALKEGMDIRDSWSYQSVAQIARAHSLLRSFEEVDESKTAITGISWGGFLTCLVVGVDGRFSAAVPVYGCGFVCDSDLWRGNFEGVMDAKHLEIWKDNFDPSNGLAKTDVPMLFVNGTSDPWYEPEIWSRSVSLVKDAQVKIIKDFPHSHAPSWGVEEIQVFIESCFGKQKPLPIFASVGLDGGSVSAKIVSAEGIISARLFYTDSPISSPRGAKWRSVPMNPSADGSFRAELPQNARTFYIEAEDSRSFKTTSNFLCVQK